MIPTDSERITGLLNDLGRGETGAHAEIVPLIYPELRKMAARYLRRERQDHTLQPTALVHEAYLRMLGQRNHDWQNRAHFFAVAAELMRQILVDHARKRQAAKRGGGAFQVELSEALIATDSAADQVLEIDEAIRKLSQLDPRQAEVVVMCVFGGLTEEEIASVLKVSGRTVKRDWSMAKAWLRGVLSSASAKNDG
jgi:RNA polymerase sigma factor (TIGR02999 family)